MAPRYDHHDGFRIRGHATDHMDDRGRERSRSRSPRRTDDRAHWRARDEFGGWHSAEQPALPPASTGEQDVAALDDQVMPFLLIRGLRPKIKLEVLSKGIEKLYRDGSSALGATVGSLKRILRVMDRLPAPHAPVNFIFAEFFTSEEAGAALAKARALDAAFTIGSNVVFVDFPVASVFRHPSSVQGARPADAFEFNGQPFVYHDNRRYYVAIEVVNETPPPSIAHAQNTTDTVVDAPAPKPKAKKENVRDKPKMEFVRRWEKKAEEDLGITPHSNPKASSKATGGHLRNEPSSASAPTPELGTDAGQTFFVDGYYSDKVSHCCALCVRKLAKTITAKQHITGPVHQQNIQDTKKVEAAYAKMKTWGVSENDTAKVTLP